eukprot:gene7008-8143_t
MEQFGRAMNIYFLFIGIMQLFPSITPVDPISTWGALIFIFAVSAIKEAYDDWNRRIRDKTANERKYSVLRDNDRVQLRSQDIMVGDIIHLENDAEVPCDMVLLMTADPEGTCFVQTSNLDGETDLKTRLAPPETSGYTVHDLLRFRGVIECPAPNADVYRFDARMSMRANSHVNTYAHSNWVTLSADNVILQATHLRNTEFIYGVAVYTGNETKIGKNKKIPPTKWTKLDRSINRITIAIFSLQLFLVAVFGIVGEIMRRQEIATFWYLGYEKGYTSPWYEFIVIPMRFLLLNSMMIPISLKVTIDVVKYAYALFINWDLKMYYKATDSPAIANSTALSEDLGQIEYVFTDKTGTLTENIMIFSKCSIGTNIYGQNCLALDDESLHELIHSNDDQTINFFKALSLCHSVVPVIVNEQLQYKASSPDEEALVKASAHLNIRFTAKTPTMISLEVLGRPETYQLLHSFEFTSDRKRMSVVIRNMVSRGIKVVTKGADDVIFPRLVPGPDLEMSRSQIDEFAELGLRTLCVSEREITENEYQQWLREHYTPAVTSLDNRQQRMADVYEMLETGLNLLGITAIEDKLQDEVPETIYSLRQASIKVWMLTGDKYSTAIQIAHSCNLIERGCAIYTVGKDLGDEASKSGAPSNLSTADVTASIQQIHMAILRSQDDFDTLSQGQQQSRDATIVIEGHVLASVLTCAPNELLELSKLVSSVICCRVTPHQKALVVRLVKNSNKTCLSIGDGGNDVSMIQEANIGVGISGREGLQAARAADYSIARFKYLRELIFIHGRYSYLRTSFVANYCFYKSLFICFIQILFQTVSGYAGSTFFNSFSLTSYNIMFTGLPIIGYILDKDLPESILRRNPFLYTYTQEGKAFNTQVFLQWAFRSVFQALLVFSITAGPFVFGSSGVIDYNSFSMIAFTSIIFIQSFTLFFESHTVTWINHILIWGTIPLYFISVLLLNSVPKLDMYSIMDHLWETVNFWGSFVQINQNHAGNGGGGGGSGGTDLLSYDQRHSKIIKFLLYRKLTSPIAKRLAKRMDGDKEVIELVVSSQDYDDDIEEILAPAYSYDEESRCGSGNGGDDKSYGASPIAKEESPLLFKNSTKL